MINFLKDVLTCVKEIDSATNKNRFVTNPFTKIVNQTYVWTEKDLCLKSVRKTK